MLGKEAVSKIMKYRGLSAAALADKVGYNTPSGVTERLRAKQDMRVDTLAKLLSAMDCEIIVRSKIGKNETWIIDGLNENKTEKCNDL